MRSYWIMILALVLSGCSGGGSGSSNENAIENESELITLENTTVEEPGDNCVAGGQRIDTGVDDNQDSILGSSEIDSTEFSCNDENLIVSISSVPAAEYENLTFTVSLNFPRAEDLTFSYDTQALSAEADSDFEMISGALTFSAGETETTVTVPLTEDANCEDSEYVQLNVVGHDNDVSGNGEIADNCDIDVDNDGLIEVYSLARLDWVRNNETGTSLIDNEGFELSEGCLNGTCSGYELMTSLDFDTNGNGEFDSGDQFYNNGEGWEPITQISNASVEGNGFSVSNLTIKRGSTERTGLFAAIADTSVSNLSLIDVNIECQRICGGLTGIYESSSEQTISNIHVTGAMTASMDLNGMILGYLSLDDGADIQLSELSAEGSLQGGNKSGGLIGYMLLDSTESQYQLSNSHASVDVQGYTAAGGLIGSVYQYDLLTSSSITNSYATGAVSGTDYIGGLIGKVDVDYQWLDITSVYTTGAVSGEQGFIGGLIGYLSYSSPDTTTPHVFSNNYATGTVSSDGGEQIGGLVGKLVANTAALSLDSLTATGTINAFDSSYVAGAIGDVRINNSVVDFQNITIEADVNAEAESGGMIGFMHLDNSARVTVDRNKVDSVITCTEYCGGLIGNIVTANGATLDASRNVTQASLAVESGYDYIGGLSGQITINGESAMFSQNIVEVTMLNDASDYSEVGGFIGSFSIHRSIESVDTRANLVLATVIGQSDVGGFIGRSDVAASEEYVSIDGNLLIANVSSSTSNNIGAFAGSVENTTYTENYYLDNNSGLDDYGVLLDGSDPGSNITAYQLSELQCPQSAGDLLCGNSLYASWSSYNDDNLNPVWDFGSASQLPGITIDGVVYRDADGDGLLD